MSTPIKYFGGKSNMLAHIFSYFPNQYRTYIEPFGGSFSVGMNKEPSPIEIYNDLEQNVYSLYKVLSTKELFTQFKERCDLLYYSEDLRKEFKANLKTEISVVDRALYFFYVNRTSHNGMGGISLNLGVRRNMSKSVSDFLSAIDGLYDLHQRLSRVIVLNRDGIELIQNYNYDDVFIYCDPPYEQETRTSARYIVDMSIEQHKKFLRACLDSKARILISGYDHRSYACLVEAGWEKHQFEVNTTTGTHEKKIKVETVWRNYTNCGVLDLT